MERQQVTDVEIERAILQSEDSVTRIALQELLEIRRQRFLDSIVDPCVFVREYRLEAFIEEADREIQKAFGKPMDTRLEMWFDPSCGGPGRLQVVIVLDDWSERHDAFFNAFCFDWWYDRIKEHDRVAFTCKVKREEVA